MDKTKVKDFNEINGEINSSMKQIDLAEKIYLEGIVKNNDMINQYANNINNIVQIPDGIIAEVLNQLDFEELKNLRSNLSEKYLEAIKEDKNIKLGERRSKHTLTDDILKLTAGLYEGVRIKEFEKVYKTTEKIATSDKAIDGEINIVEMINTFKKQMQELEFKVNNQEKQISTLTKEKNKYVKMLKDCEKEKKLIQEQLELSRLLTRSLNQTKNSLSQSEDEIDTDNRRKKAKSSRDTYDQQEKININGNDTTNDEMESINDTTVIDTTASTQKSIDVSNITSSSNDKNIDIRYSYSEATKAHRE